MPTIGEQTADEVFDHGEAMRQMVEASRQFSEAFEAAMNEPDAAARPPQG